MLSNGQVLFKRVRENECYFAPQTNTINQLQLHTLLTRLNDTIIRENKNLNKNMPELEYIVEKMSGLLQYVFEPKSSIYFKW
jgi:uncharacterized coiled-coil protein SlyX